MHRILNPKRCEYLLHQIALDIYEKHYKESGVILIGVQKRGFLLAQQIYERIKARKQPSFQLLLYPIEKDAQTFEVTDKPLPLVLVDDVIYSGRTLMRLSSLLYHQTERLSVACLIDRGHRRYPIAPQFVGLSLATTLQQYIKVTFDKDGIKVYLC